MGLPIFQTLSENRCGYWDSGASQGILICTIVLLLQYFQLVSICSTWNRFHLSGQQFRRIHKDKAACIHYIALVFV